MSFLNLNYQLLIYEEPSSKNPNVRQPDISRETKNIPVSSERTEKITLFPNDITTLSTTARVLNWDNTTEFEFSQPYNGLDVVRMSWTGTGLNPAFRSRRSIAGDATTVVSISRVTPYVARITVISGTAWNTSSVQVGDLIKFEKNTVSFTSPFSETNQGLTLKIQAKGSNYIDFNDDGLSSPDSNITLGADYLEALKVFSQGPVKIHDTIFISSSAANPSNKGKFAITDVSPDYIEFVNPLVLPETVLYDAGFVIYNYLIGFVLLRSTGNLMIKVGGQTEWAEIQKIGQEAVFLASVGTYEIQAMNSSNFPVEVTIHTAQTMVG